MARSPLQWLPRTPARVHCPPPPEQPTHPPTWRAPHCPIHCQWWSMRRSPPSPPHGARRRSGCVFHSRLVPSGGVIGSGASLSTRLLSLRRRRPALFGRSSVFRERTGSGWLPVEGHLTDGDGSSRLGTVPRQFALHAEPIEPIDKISHGLLVVEIRLTHPAFRLAPLDHEPVPIVGVHLDGE